MKCGTRKDSRRGAEAQRGMQGKDLKDLRDVRGLRGAVSGWADSFFLFSAPLRLCASFLLTSYFFSC